MKLQKDVSLIKRLERDKKGLKAEDNYKAAGTAYDCVELLLSVHNPIFVKKPPLNEKGEVHKFPEHNNHELQKRSTPSGRSISTSPLSNKVKQ